MTLLTETARAKVNLTLRVLGRRADGYHDLESLVVFADCADTLTFEPAPQIGLSVSGPGAQECGDTDDNLVVRASRSLAEIIPGLVIGRFTLDKHLPVAAGIGGGSADAAAALRLLARANDLAIEDPRIVDVARATGADIPVCLASRACTMTGVGDHLSMLDIPAMPCVMINPRVAVATREVFAALGLAKGEFRAGVGDVLLSPGWPSERASPEEWLQAIIAGTNDLEEPALKVEGIIGDVLSALRETGDIQLARMSGSGATCFGIYPSTVAAHAAAAVIAQSHPGWWVHAGVLS